MQNIIAITHPDATKEMTEMEDSDSDNSVCVDDIEDY